MLQHNIKLAFRNFKKDKSTFLINLIGLSTGLACAILIFMWVLDENGIDKFHKNDKVLYQVLSNHFQNGEVNTWQDNPAKMPEAFRNEIPQVKDAVGVCRSYGINGLKFENNYLQATGNFVGDNFFKIFSFEMLEGNVEKIFPNRNGIAISEDIAIKFFTSHKNALGKTISYESEKGDVEMVVSGVFKKLPKNSSLQFDFLLPYEKLITRLGENAHWTNFHARTYVLLHENVESEVFNETIKNFIKEKAEGAEVELFAQQFSQTYLNNNYENGVIAGGRITYVKLFSLIAIFILLIACINFMNLSTANATKKYKEIGVKKTIGADRRIFDFSIFRRVINIKFFSIRCGGIDYFFSSS